MCTVAMFKFRFKASFNLLSGKKSGGEQRDKNSDIPILGAYRSNREEYFGNEHYNNNSKKLTASMLTLPQTTPKPKVKPSKSTSNLLKSNEVPETSGRIRDIPPSDNKKRPKDIKSAANDQRILDRQKVTKVHKTEKLEENKIELEHQTSKTKQVKPNKEKKKAPAPKPPSNQQKMPVYSSDTLESSISRSSGPPPYSTDVVPNQQENSGNISFGKTIDGTSTWDLVSQHRQQLNRPRVTSTVKHKSNVLDLRYESAHTSGLKDNSKA
ncbi:uncharacterized protein [Battus philenor]|uniref:uncharacterized protein n=1 Tax=Battus philenor TaxID=42288 RepID=UPI0035D0C28F